MSRSLDRLLSYEKSGQSEVLDRDESKRGIAAFKLFDAAIHGRDLDQACGRECRL